MRFLAAAIVLSFPILDVIVTSRIARWTGIPVWVLLLFGLASGIALLRNERYAFRSRTVAAMHGEVSMMRGLLDSGRKVLAGFLFLLPGLVSDFAGLALLLLPINGGRDFQAAGVRNARTIEGGWRRMK